VYAEDTIVAVATAPGVGALAIVRLSGPGAHEIAEAVLGRPQPATRVATLRKLHDATGAILDEGIVIRYDRPASYTGEDGLEITCHGGPVTATRIARALIEAGARPALPGEFTRRAVLAGRLDLLQAEAINDLIRADSTAGAQLALQQMDGGLSRRILQLREELLGLEAMVTYEIDFPEEDDGPIDEARIEAAVRMVINSIDRLVATTPGGELIRQGAIVAIVGPPNVGKSSLFNALLGRQRALVTDVPGTTRDALEAVLDVVPVPLRLVDTAGLRETADHVEQLGVAVSRDYLGKATVVLACGDTEETLADARAETRAVNGDTIVVAVRTKCDLGGRQSADACSVSALTGEGLDALVRSVSELAARHAALPSAESPVLTHTRYRQLLRKARAELQAFQTIRLRRDVPTVVSAVHLREGVRLLEELIGGVDVEEVLTRVFSSFCVGK
jgi:tRNA modification GTPase